MPLVHNGDEAGNERRHAFFERDPIRWGDVAQHPLSALYRRLFGPKRTNRALWNGRWGGRMIEVPSSVPSQVLSFVRRRDTDAVFAVLNLSDEPVTPAFGEGPHLGSYTDVGGGEDVTFDGPASLILDPRGHRIFATQNGN